MKKIITSGVTVISLFLMAGAAYAVDKQISKDGYFGCKDKDYFEKLISYAVQNDKDAFTQGLAGGVLTGQCTMFKAGEKVFLVDTAIFSGLAKVRRKGNMAEYWTNMEAIH
jgi:hypothetical protein